MTTDGAVVLTATRVHGKWDVKLPASQMEQGQRPVESALEAWEQNAGGKEISLLTLKETEYYDLNDTRYYVMQGQDTQKDLAKKVDSYTENHMVVTAWPEEVWQGKSMQLGGKQCSRINRQDWAVLNEVIDKIFESNRVRYAYARRSAWYQQEPRYKAWQEQQQQITDLTGFDMESQDTTMQVECSDLGTPEMDQQHIRWAQLPLAEMTQMNPDQEPWIQSDPDEEPTDPATTNEKSATNDRPTQTVKVDVRKQRRVRHTQPCCTSAEWHERLAHASKTLIKDPRLGLKFAPEPGGTFCCEACEIAKIKRTRMTGGGDRWFVMSETVRRKPEAMYFMDIGGPYPKSRFQGYTYVLVFSSPCGYIYTHFMKDRSTANVCAGLMNLLCLLPANQIEMIQSDHAGEFISAEFKALCGTNAIDCRTLPRGSPMLNGGAERAIETLKSLTATVAHAAGVGTSWWPLIMGYVAFAQSLLIHGDNQSTGMKLAFGYEVSHSRCHVWGSDCVVWTHPVLREDSFETRGKLAMFCGVDIARNGYIVYIPAT